MMDAGRAQVPTAWLRHWGTAATNTTPYRARKLLVAASETITRYGRSRLRGLLDAGDPYREVRDAWHAEETLRGIYDITDPQVGATTVAQLAQDLQD